MNEKEFEKAQIERDLRELGWDDVIENDGPDFVLLPEGDYDFEVTKFERGRHNGSEKLPPCNKAIITLKIEGKEGIAVVTHNLFLHSKCEGMLCAFFTAIGQRKHGEALKMNWNNVMGAKGRLKLGIRKWKGNDGTEYTSNDVKKFYEPKADATPAPASAWQAGQF